MANLAEIATKQNSEGTSWVQNRPFIFPHFLGMMNSVAEVIDAKSSTLKKGEFMSWMSDWFNKAHVMLISNEIAEGKLNFRVKRDPLTNQETDDDDQPLGLPFDYCFFEIPNKNFIVGGRISLMWIMAIEIGGVTSICSYGLDGDAKLPDFFVYSDNPNDPEHRKSGQKTIWLRRYVAAICDTLRDNQAATERVNIRQKARVYGKNVHHKISEVIHILPKKTSPITRAQEGTVIDWTHRWEVRGHYRKINGIGKDRNGSYNVNGYTWVSAHERGPENKPLVKKIRVFHSEKKQD